MTWIDLTALYLLPGAGMCVWTLTTDPMAKLNWTTAFLTVFELLLWPGVLLAAWMFRGDDI